MSKNRAKSKIMDITIFHNKLGHPSELYTKTTAKMIYGISLTGEMKVCEGCAYGKAHRKPVKKYILSVGKATLWRESLCTQAHCHVGAWEAQVSGS